jgi:hypothetical protein
MVYGVVEDFAIDFTVTFTFRPLGWVLLRNTSTQVGGTSGMRQCKPYSAV